MTRLAPKPALAGVAAVGLYLPAMGMPLPDPTAVATFDGNDPGGLADMACSALAQPPIDPNLLHSFRQENSWFDRVDTFLANANQ